MSYQKFSSGDTGHVQASPGMKELMHRIIASGSGSTEVFGYLLLEDGLYLQQHPWEFAEFVDYMSNNESECELSLDVGIASGGQTKFLRDYYRCKKTIIVDLGTHPDAVHWNRIKKDLNSELIEEIFGDSHSDHVRERLSKYKGEIGFAYVDGDHSYVGLRKDIFLVREVLKPGSLMVLHDTMAVPDCARVYEELLCSNTFEHVRSFHRRFGISIWRLKAPVNSTEENRTRGEGAL